MSAPDQAEVILRRWEWRMIHSPQGAIALRQLGAPDADAQIAALGEQATEEMKAAHQAARQAPALRVQELEGRVEDIQQQLRSLGVGDEPPVFAPRTDMLPRISMLMALLLTMAIAATAAFAAGAFLEPTAPSAYAAEIAAVILAAIAGAAAGDALTRLRTKWAIRIAIGAIGLSAVAAYLVAWVAGLGQERRLLLTVLVLITTLIAGAIWAMKSFSRQPRSEDAHQVAIARRVAALSDARRDLGLALARLEGVDGEWRGATLRVESLHLHARASDGYANERGVAASQVPIRDAAVVARSPRAQAPRSTCG